MRELWHPWRDFLENIAAEKDKKAADAKRSAIWKGRISYEANERLKQLRDDLQKNEKEVNLAKPCSDIERNNYNPTRP